MSTPGEGEGGGRPPYQPGSPYGGPGSYGQGQPGQYGSPPPYGQQGGYAYNPYTSSPYSAGPAGLGESEPPPRRPGIMVLSLILLILSSLPFLLVGAILLAVPLDPATLEQLLARVGQAQVTPDQVATVIRIAGGILVAIPAIYILFAVLAFTGRNWARILVAVLTVGFALLLAAGLVNGGAADGASVGLVVAVLVASIGGTVIMFLPEPRDWFARPSG